MASVKEFLLSSWQEPDPAPVLYSADTISAWVRRAGCSFCATSTSKCQFGTLVTVPSRSLCSCIILVWSPVRWSWLFCVFVRFQQLNSLMGLNRVWSQPIPLQLIGAASPWNTMTTAKRRKRLSLHISNCLRPECKSFHQRPVCYLIKSHHLTGVLLFTEKKTY